MKKPAVVKDKKVKTTPTVAAPKQTSGEIFFQLDDKGRSQIVRDRNYKPTVVEIDLVEEDNDDNDEGDLRAEEVEGDKYDYGRDDEGNGEIEVSKLKGRKNEKTEITENSKIPKNSTEIPSVTPNTRNKKIQITLEGVTVASATIGSPSVPISTPTTSTITENSGNSKNSGISGNSTEILSKSTGTESKEVPSVPKAAEAVSGTIGSISAPSSTSTSTSSSEKSEISENSGISRNSTVNVGDKAASNVRSEATVEVESVVASVSTGETSAPVKPVRVPLWKR